MSWMFKNTQMRILIPVLVVGFLIALTEGATYKPLACYLDDPSDRDLTGKQITFSKLSLEGCTSACAQDGFPYSGLQAGKACYCGLKYGTHGVSTGCNYTCSGIPCGGPIQNNMYYSLNIDSKLLTERQDIVHLEPLSWTEARKTCISNNGDLAAITSTDDMNSTMDAIIRGGVTSERAWIGLWKRRSGGPYEWADPAVAKFVSSKFTTYWAADESWTLDCVSFSLSSKKWETASCSGEFPYVCNQIPPKPTEAPSEDEAGTGDEEVQGDFFSKNKKIVFYVIIPLFFFCYGGSCIVYIIGKLCKLFRTKKQTRLLGNDDYAEFEPDTKPLNGGPARSLSQFSLRSNKVAPAPRSVRLPPHYQRENRTPNPYTLPPPPAFAPEPFIVPSTTPKNDDLPRPASATSVNFETPRPQTRQEAHRSALLQNALKEARERRAKENGEEPDDRRYSPEGEENKEDVVERPPSQENRTPNTKSALMKKYPQFNGRDTPDFSQMSIQEILRMKQVVRDNRKARAKRILQA